MLHALRHAGRLICTLLVSACTILTNRSFPCRIALKALRVNNRCLFGVMLIASICGTVLASDWQTLGETDPCTLLNATHNKLEDLSLSTQYELKKVCLSQSSQCYWNQDSQLSDTYCTLCRSVCRSEWMTINLFQFCVAVLIIHQAGIIGWAAIVSVTTDCTPHSLQVKQLHAPCNMLYNDVAWTPACIYCLYHIHAQCRAQLLDSCL